MFVDWWKIGGKVYMDRKFKFELCKHGKDEIQNSNGRSCLLKTARTGCGGTYLLYQQTGGSLASLVYIVSYTYWETLSQNTTKGKDVLMQYHTHPPTGGG